MLSEHTCTKSAELIRRLDEAVDTECVAGRCGQVKEILEDIFHSGEEFLPAEFLEPAGECYARRLLHRDPTGRYSVVVMVWNVGQGTSLHDHAGEWCVECVYRGRIKVTSYDKVSADGDELYKFKEEATIYAGKGEAGALIPPFEYHTISNAVEDKPSVTVHVYGHELTWCHIFVPTEGGYERVRKELSYTAS